MQKRKLEPFS